MQFFSTMISQFFSFYFFSRIVIAIKGLEANDELIVKSTVSINFSFSFWRGLRFETY